MEEKSRFGRIWSFLWESDSAFSWIVDLILAFLIIKFIFFPVIGLVLSSSLPMVIVESGSMVHNGNFDEFWSSMGSFYEDIGITKEMFSGWYFKDGFNKGDIMVIQGQSSYKIGDVIVFNVPGQSTPIIHRIIKINEDLSFSTKGDHNLSQLPDEKSVKKEQIIGKAAARIPWLGWLKLGAAEMLSLFVGKN